jgi:CDP-diacylglycerol--serine O-phosphatidyltransferase
VPVLNAADLNMNNPPSLPSSRRRGIYVLPNLLTTAALFCGYFAIVQAMNKQFEASAIAIFVAMVLDGLDGRVARLTGTQSEFGAQYDSLSDMVSFGVAPALLAYEWALMSLGKLGWIISFIYCSGAALRLARFNTNIGSVDKRFFQGLPSPASAALIAGMVWVSIDNGFSPDENIWLKPAACLLTLIAGISMVSNFPFWSGKNINLRKSVPFIVVIALALAFALAALYPPGVFFGLFVCYALSGYVLSFWRWRRRKAAAAAAQETESPPSPEPDTEILDAPSQSLSSEGGMPLVETETEVEAEAEAVAKAVAEAVTIAAASEKKSRKSKKDVKVSDEEPFSEPTDDDSSPDSRLK